MAANIRHSSNEPKWGTQPAVINIARPILGMACDLRTEWGPAIYVDPFSEPEFNAHVGAHRILTGEKGLNGFKDRWIEHELAPRADHILGAYPITPRPDGAGIYTALMNPPGDERGENMKNAWRILVGYYVTKWIDSAIFVSFNLNTMQTLQGIASLSPLNARFTGCRCVPDRRLPFVAHSSRPKTRIDRHGDEIENDDAPSHPCYFLLMPSHDDIIAADQLRLFESMGSKIGEVF